MHVGLPQPKQTNRMIKKSNKNACRPTTTSDWQDQMV